MLQLNTVKIILLSTPITGLTAIQWAYAAAKCKAITTFTVIADMAQNVAGTPQKPVRLPGLAQKSMNISLQPEL
ncbi:manganese ABC transporter substrate-binding protein SitA [Klebsiella variicola]|nr:manganese ABC transporter substrate-binding protein SitA [Klebsiella variicola]VUK85847.1 manganese ABC transporter substrate-binding protein SitA [Klebsiella variicola]